MTDISGSGMMTMLGPWELREKIYSRRNSEVAIYATSDPEWVVKVYKVPSGDTDSAERAYDELQAVIELQAKRVPHRVETPLQPHRFFGTSPEVVWYAMMRYQGALSVDTTARSYWRTIAVSVLTFLQYFHTRCRKVHMDIKCPNILVEHPQMRFVVSDYDLAGNIRPDKVTRSYRPDTCWYYVAMGAELDEPLYSWRMDLTALGYMLAAITWDEGYNGPWKFYDECMLRRDGHRGLDVSDDYLIEMRESEMSRINITVRTYLNMVAARVGWRDVETPSKEFYGELMALFC